ncbi:hypothetical protein DdX_16598 [Ditylenchus destructor]|uniref:Uncharacterized protein n=1 Tax=Ditylenchus destructor TaxID=166010 RepID=A0AAD4MQK9_9BILA|nr:hypothetical protein DdX_16598 [Ditylenchus destructor]
MRVVLAAVWRHKLSNVLDEPRVSPHNRLLHTSWLTLGLRKHGRLGWVLGWVVEWVGWLRKAATHRLENGLGLRLRKAATQRLENGMGTGLDSRLGWGMG